MNRLVEFLNSLEEVKIHYTLDKVNDEYIMVKVAVPGQRWEVEFSETEIRIEKFISNGSIDNETELDNLFMLFSN